LALVKEKTMEERRKSVRIETNAMIDVLGKEVLMFHRIRDLSMGGVCIETESLEPVGSEVDLVINFPDLDEIIETKGVVVWAHEEPRPGMAIKFVDLKEEDKMVLRRYLGMLESRQNNSGK
jgi:uncharacterized protein (TIGR02266 family)